MTTRWLVVTLAMLGCGGPRAEEGEDAGVVVVTDAGVVVDGGAAWYGFRSCGAPTMTALPVEPAFALEDGSTVPIPLTSLRDLSFDGRGAMLVAARDSGGAEAGVYELNASGGVRRVFGAGAASVTGVRTLAGGQYLVTGTFSQGASVLPGITTLSSSGDVTGRLEFPRGFPWGALAMPNGGFLVIDSTVERQLVQFPSATLPALVPPAVDTTTASGAHPTQQRAAVLSADARHLLVAAQNDDTIHEYEVSEAGVIDGASRRVYAALPDASPRSLAFDVCGNLYVSAHARSAGGTLIGALLRIPAGGGAPFTLATFDQPDTNRVIAFGRGGVFPSTNLYVADASAHVVLRVKVGVEGAQ